MNYRGYVHSKHWIQVKEIYYSQHSRQCLWCGSLDHVALHHLHYQYLGMEELHLECLVPLCDEHHSLLHSMDYKPSHQVTVRGKRIRVREIPCGDLNNIVDPHSSTYLFPMDCTYVENRDWTIG